MAFTVEDGTGVADANSYVAVAFADAYFLDRNNAAWAALDDTVKQASLIAATDYLDARFGAYLKGLKVDDAQALEFPRDAFTLIPAGIKKAICEYAVRASIAVLAADPDVDPSGYQISEKYEKVGAIEERTSFATIGSGSVRNLLKPYPAADMLMRPFIKAVSASVIRN